MNLKTIKEFCVLFLVDAVMLFCLFSFAKFMISKLTNYLMNLQSSGFDFQNIQESALQNISNINLDLLSGNLENINQIMQKIAVYSIYTLIGLFLIYCLFQAVQWNLVCHKMRFRNFGRYLLKFVLVNIPILIVVGYLLYGIAYHLRGLIFNSWIEGTYMESQFSYSGSFPVLVLFGILLLAVIYFKINLYILMNKYKLKEALLKTINNFKEFKLILRFFVYFVIFFLISFTLGINPILWLVLCLCLIEIFRMDFSRLLK